MSKPKWKELLEANADIIRHVKSLRQELRTKANRAEDLWYAIRDRSISTDKYRDYSDELVELQTDMDTLHIEADDYMHELADTLDRAYENVPFRKAIRQGIDRFWEESEL